MFVNHFKTKTTVDASVHMGLSKCKMSIAPMSTVQPSSGDFRINYFYVKWIEFQIPKFDSGLGIWKWD